MSDLTTLKRCTQCGESFPSTTEHFYVDRSCKAGLTPQCRACRKAAWAKSAEKTNEKSRAKWAANADEINARKREQRAARGDEYLTVKRKWKAANPDKVKAGGQRYYVENKDTIAAKQKEKRKKPEVREQERERLRDYRERNPEKVRMWGRLHEHKRNTRKAELPNTFRQVDWRKCLDYFGGCCVACGSSSSLFSTIEMDHWIPLSSKECPGTIPENMIPLCISCNSGKRDRNAEEWATDRFGKRRGKEIAARVQAYFDSLG